MEKNIQDFAAFVERFDEPDEAEVETARRIRAYGAHVSRAIEILTAARFDLKNCNSYAADQKVREALKELQAKV